MRDQSGYFGGRHLERGIQPCLTRTGFQVSCTSAFALYPCCCQCQWHSLTFALQILQKISPVLLFPCGFSQVQIAAICNNILCRGRSSPLCIAEINRHLLLLLASIILSLRGIKAVWVGRLQTQESHLAVKLWK